MIWYLGEWTYMYIWLATKQCIYSVCMFYVIFFLYFQPVHFMLYLLVAREYSVDTNAKRHFIQIISTLIVNDWCLSATHIQYTHTKKAFLSASLFQNVKIKKSDNLVVICGKNFVKITGAWFVFWQMIGGGCSNF